MSSLLFRHDFTAQACIPPCGALLAIAENAVEKSGQHRKMVLILSALGALCGENSVLMIASMTI